MGTQGRRCLSGAGRGAPVSLTEADTTSEQSGQIDFDIRHGTIIERQVDLSPIPRPARSSTLLVRVEDVVLCLHCLMARVPASGGAVFIGRDASDLGS